MYVVQKGRGGTRARGTSSPPRNISDVHDWFGARGVPQCSSPVRGRREYHRPAVRPPFLRRKRNERERRAELESFQVKEVLLQVFVCLVHTQHTRARRLPHLASVTAALWPMRSVPSPWIKSGYFDGSVSDSTVCSLHSVGAVLCGTLFVPEIG